MDTGRGSIRHDVRIDRPADQVWALVGDPGRMQEWFPAVTASSVEGTERVVTLAGGQALADTIVTLDPLQRRLRHTTAFPLARSHLGTLDVVALDAGSCLVVYGTDAEPAAMALAIAGAVGAALDHLKAMFESGV